MSSVISDDNLEQIFSLVVHGNELVSEKDDCEKKIVKRVLREFQQKRVMNSRIIIEKKKECYDKDSKTYICPFCKKNFKQLQAAHIGEPIMNGINDIVDMYFDTYNFIGLCKKVIELENKSLIVPACASCNNKLDISKNL